MIKNNLRLGSTLTKTMVLVFFILTGLLCPHKIFSQTYTLNVGERMNLPIPTPPLGTIDGSPNYECTNKSECIGVSGSKIYVHHYFSGTANIVCTYNYSYRSPYTNKMVVDHSTITYYITCEPTTVKLNKSELTIEAGEEFQFIYETIPSGLEPLIEWVTDDKSIADFYGSSDPGLIYAKKEGTCVVTAKCNTGMPDPKCTINVIDNYWVKTDILSGIVDKGTKVTLTCSKLGATIYYTTDGTEPTKSSLKYTSPIVINQSTELKAKAYVGNQESRVTERTYTVYARKEGEVFETTTVEGVKIIMKDYKQSTTSLYLQVGDGEKPSIDPNYSGPITIPFEVDGIGVRAIEKKAFINTKITSLIIPDYLPDRIYANAFEGCKYLKSVSLNGSMPIDIGDECFKDCVSLESFTRGKNMLFRNSKSRTNAKKVFENCKNIKYIFYDGYPFEFDDNVFPIEVYNTAILYHKGDINSFKTTKGWKNFKNIIDGSTGIMSRINDTKEYPVYNLKGQRLDKPRKGINIIGGKKVVIK